MIRDLNIFCTVTRSLVKTGRMIAVTDNPVPVIKFMGSLELPRSGGPVDDGSPRTGPRYVLRWRQGPLGLPDTDLVAGERVTLTRPLGGSRLYENMVYEFLDNPRLIRSSHDNFGIQAEILPVGDLYPFTAVLKEQGGVTVATVPIALWSSAEAHQETGTYEDFDGEAPVEFGTVIKANRALWFDTERYMVLSAVTDLKGPRVTFTARRSNA